MTVISRAEAHSTIYRAAADAMVAIDFSAPAVGANRQRSVVDGDVDALLSAAEAELLATVAGKFAALRAATRAASSVADDPQPSVDLDDLVRPMMIIRDYDISRAELFRRCVDHPVGTPGGFSLRRDGEGSHLISLSRFDRHFRQYPPRGRRFETGK